MARKRVISPEIWQSEDFSRLSTLAKLIFIGMFSNADDEGRGRGKAVYLKSIIFPYDEAIRVTDIDKALSEISSNMSVIFYTYNENIYYELTNWNKWQKVEKPQSSIIPAFDENDETIQRLFDDCSATCRGRVSPKRKEEKRKEENRKEIEEKRISLVETYNKYCTNLPQCLKTTDKRKKGIDEFLKVYTLEQFEELCKKSNITPFLIGKNDRKWKADIDFLLRIDKATSILEGKYDNIGKSSSIDNLKNAYNQEVEKDDERGNNQDIDVFGI